MSRTNARRRRDQQDRGAKVAAIRRAQEAKARRRRFAWIALVVIVVLGAAGGLVAGILASHSSGAIAGVRTFAEDSPHTTAAVKYKQNPPVGGPHDPTLLNCGIYDKPVRNENAVHDLEHGAVWITYRPDLAVGQVDSLRRVAGQTYVTLSPYPGLPAPVVVTGWGAQLRLDSASDPRLSKFIAKYKQSAKAPEPGASCVGGIGTPTG